MQQFGLNEKSQSIFKAKLANMTCVCVRSQSISTSGTTMCLSDCKAPVHFPSALGFDLREPVPESEAALCFW